MTYNLTFTMTNIILYFTQYCQCSTYWHLMKNRLLPCNRVLRCIYAFRSNKGCLQLRAQRFHIVCYSLKEQTISMYLFFKNFSIPFLNTILLRHISIVWFLDITYFGINFTFIATYQLHHIVLESLYIIIEFIRNPLHFHCLIIPFFRFFRILIHCNTEFGICISITFLHGLNGSMQTLVHFSISIQYGCTDVECQHSSQHQVHHTNHLLSRGFRTIRSSTHNTILYINKVSHARLYANAFNILPYTLFKSAT